MKLTEHLWRLDVKNETGFFQLDLGYDTGMHHSAKEGNVEDIEFYLDHLSYEKNPESKIEGIEKGCTPMHIAAKHGHLNVIQLIKTSIDVMNPADADGNTVLHYAAANGHLEIVQEVMEDLEEKNPAAMNKERLTPMHLAAKYGHLSVLQEIKKITDISNPSNPKGWSVLHSAAFNGHLPIVKEICNDLEKKNPAGYSDIANMTPLHVASEAGHLKIVKFYHKILSDISVVDSNGMNALHHAAKGGHILLVEFLITVIPINIKDSNGKTAKELASCHESVVSYLQSLDRHSNETREQGALRRLEKVEGKTYEMMISKIKEETEKELPSAIKTTIDLLSQSGWPSNIKPCIDYNKGVCDKSVLHDEDTIHMCALCKKMFGASFFHPAKSCEILKKLDSEMTKSVDECLDNLNLDLDLDFDAELTEDGKNFNWN